MTTETREYQFTVDQRINSAINLSLSPYPEAGAVRKGLALAGFSIVPPPPAQSDRDAVVEMRERCAQIADRNGWEATAAQIRELSITPPHRGESK